MTSREDDEGGSIDLAALLDVEVVGLRWQVEGLRGRLRRLALRSEPGLDHPSESADPAWRSG